MRPIVRYIAVCALLSISPSMSLYSDTLYITYYTSYTLRVPTVPYCLSPLQCHVVAANDWLPAPSRLLFSIDMPGTSYTLYIIH